MTRPDDETDDTLDGLLRDLAHTPDQPLPASFAREPPPPATFGPVSSDSYRVVGEHARGGMGRILIAYQTRVGRAVAVKELLERDPQSEARFVHEALLTARLQHPSIVPVYDVGRRADNGDPFYAMKLVDGQPLSELIAARRTVSERLGLLPSLIAVCEAVAYAHSRGIVHRDLKPTNVLVGNFGETLVIDWGLAKRVGAPTPSLEGAIADLPSGETQLGAVVGTPDYMPPE